jgi:hypothetical protein
MARIFGRAHALPQGDDAYPKSGIVSLDGGRTPPRPRFLYQHPTVKRDQPRSIVDRSGEGWASHKRGEEVNEHREHHMIGAACRKCPWGLGAPRTEGEFLEQGDP